MVTIQHYLRFFNISQKQEIDFQRFKSGAGNRHQASGFRYPVPEIFIFAEKNNSMERIAIFASGNGSNAQRIIEYFRESAFVKTILVLSNNPSAYVLERAEILKVPHVVFSREELYQSGKILALLAEHETTLVILAGFLWLVPQNLLNAFPGRIVNIHPALLPKYGGKGMYGMKVHEAVIAAKEKESGITIHYVNDSYDEGQVIFQAKCPVSDHETPESLAAKVHQLEYRYYPEVIEMVLGNF
jgi:phosphoribosylglycinamide formyltransferase 1